MYKNSSRFQKWSKLCGKDSREHEEARDARIDRSSERKRVPATPSEEFRRTFEKLRIASRLLREKLDEMVGVPGWEQFIRRASEIQAQWAHLSDEVSDPRPSYDDYLAVRRVYEDLVGVIAALFDPEAAVIVALNELKELREKYGECKPDYSQQDAEERAEGMLAICEQIKEQIEDAERNLGPLIFEVPAFETHDDRYYDETEGQR